MCKLSKMLTEARGRPKVKKLKSALPSLEYTTRGFRIRDGVLCLPGNLTVPVVWSRDLPSDPTSVRVYRDTLGHRQRCAAERAKAQRRMARRRGPQGAAASKGYLRAKRQSARIEKKAARQNTHDARQWAARVVDAHHLIAVEDFKSTFLATAERVRASADDIRHSIASFRGGGSDAVRAGNPPDSSAGKR